MRLENEVAREWMAGEGNAPEEMQGSPAILKALAEDAKEAPF
jgi:hypothetical protein